MNDNSVIIGLVHDALKAQDESARQQGIVTAKLQAALDMLQSGNVPPQIKRLEVPYIAQNNPLLTNDDFTASDCGPACVAMILAYVGHPATVDQVSKATGLPANFKYTTAPNLIKAAAVFDVTLIHQFGSPNDPVGPLTVDYIKGEIDRGRPVIALVHYPSLPIRSDPHFTGGHFVVVVGYDRTSGGILYHDPYWMDTTGAFIQCSGIAFSTAQANSRLNGNRPFQGLTVKIQGG